MKHTLVGVDGNAFAIMAYVKKAMSKEGFSNSFINEYLNKAMSSDYNNLLITSLEMIDECNDRAGEEFEEEEEDW